MSREPSEEDRYLLDQLAGLQRDLAPLEGVDTEAAAPQTESAVVLRSALVLKRVAEYEHSIAVRRAAEQTAKVGQELGAAQAQKPDDTSPRREVVREIGEAALSIGIGALVAAGIGGPFIAMALQEKVAEKVIEAAISGAVGAFAGELTHAARSRRDRERDAKLSELTDKVGRLERMLGERQADRGERRRRAPEELAEALIRLRGWERKRYQRRQEPERRREQSREREGREREGHER